METAQPQPGILRILTMIWKGRTEATREELESLADRLESERNREPQENGGPKPPKAAR